ncbi:MAG: hypothetical protein GTO40_24955 [Deltaproteobacteria bacterium]|nr:hypothetical protein [Deltaproteobacteria bacterium]
MEIKIEMGGRAKEEITIALAAERLQNAAIVVFADEEDECCDAALDVIVVEEEEIPPLVYSKVGKVNGWPVYLTTELTPPESVRLVINVDQANRRLAALFIDGGET